MNSFHITIKTERNGRPAFIFVIDGFNIICENKEQAIGVLDNFSEFFNISGDQYTLIWNHIQEYFGPKLKRPI